jgi:hypothetical protein
MYQEKKKKKKKSSGLSHTFGVNMIDDTATLYLCFLINLRDYIRLLIVLLAVYFCLLFCSLETVMWLVHIAVSSQIL